ncbi:hypothetical protein [Niabella ginsengisoli]|uniref:Uncharacterized protein n=1 Tax=Niabella ginsengisoli TaxID=522298 RepID=A0ABS9SR19_9BACT|nr:hypothetical protein [Niabella ginsengisoli]MCH5600838.1 hypothetical protein [Niabella ginsengisoli]
MSRVLVPLCDEADAFIIDYVQKLIYNAGAQLIILDATNIIQSNAVIKERIRAIEQTAPNHISISQDKKMDSEWLKDFDLILIGLDSWKRLVESKSDWLSYIPSTLVISDNH